MNSKAQVIYNNNEPAFVVLQYKDYLALTGERPSLPDKPEFVPFVLSEYIKNPIRLKRIEAGLNQNELAKLLGVTQGYISRIETRDFSASPSLMKKVATAIGKKSKRAGAPK